MIRTNRKNSKNHTANHNTAAEFSSTNTFTNYDTFLSQKKTENTAVFCLAVGIQNRMLTSLWVVWMRKKGSLYISTSTEVGETIRKFGGTVMKKAVFHDIDGTVEIWEVEIPEKVTL